MTPSTVTVTPTTPAIVEVNFIMDGIALEPNETVSLRFLPTVSVPIQEVLLDTIELTISDVDSKSSVHTLNRPVCFLHLLFECGYEKCVQRTLVAC